MASLSISPATLEFWLQPGATYIQTYQINNTGTGPVTLTTSVDRWLPQGIDGGLNYPGLPLNLDFSLTNSDLRLGDSFILNPGQSRQLVLKIHSPVSLPPQDLYFTFFVNQPLSITNQHTTNLLRLGSHLLISVSPSETPSSDHFISEFKVSPAIHDTFFGSSTFTGLINNQSDYFSKIEGTITISKNNTTVTQFELFPSNVLAHYQRSLTCLKGDQSVTCQLPPPLWPGFYQATISIKNSGVVSTINFLVLPYSLFVFFLIIFAAFCSFKYIKIYLARHKGGC